jgi:hypothetical protein
LKLVAILTRTLYVGNCRGRCYPMTISAHVFFFLSLVGAVTGRSLPAYTYI